MPNTKIHFIEDSEHSSLMSFEEGGLTYVPCCYLGGRDDSHRVNLNVTFDIALSARQVSFETTRSIDGQLWDKGLTEDENLLFTDWGTGDTNRKKVLALESSVRLEHYTGIAFMTEPRIGSRTPLSIFGSPQSFTEASITIVIGEREYLSISGHAGEPEDEHRGFHLRLSLSPERFSELTEAMNRECPPEIKLDVNFRDHSSFYISTHSYVEPHGGRVLKYLGDPSNIENEDEFLKFYDQTIKEHDVLGKIVSWGCQPSPFGLFINTRETSLPISEIDYTRMRVPGDYFWHHNDYSQNDIMRHDYVKERVLELNDVLALYPTDATRQIMEMFQPSDEGSDDIETGRLWETPRSMVHVEFLKSAAREANRKNLPDNSRGAFMLFIKVNRIFENVLHSCQGYCGAGKWRWFGDREKYAQLNNFFSPDLSFYENSWESYLSWDANSLAREVSKYLQSPFKSQQLDRFFLTLIAESEAHGLLESVMSVNPTDQFFTKQPTSRYELACKAAKKRGGWGLRSKLFSTHVHSHGRLSDPQDLLLQLNDLKIIQRMLKEPGFISIEYLKVKFLESEKLGLAFINPLYALLADIELRGEVFV